MSDPTDTADTSKQQETAEQLANIMGPRTPKFEWGQRVKALEDLVNDGGFPGVPTDAVLVSAGQQGEIVQVGRHEETNTPVYLVEFSPDRVVGCLEEEIVPLEA